MSARPPRVLVIYGSETGNVRSAIHKCVDAWQSRTDGTAYTLVNANVITGNDAAKEFPSLVEIPHQFDVLIIATSSFGEGDPPANFANFLLTLVRASNAACKPSRRPPLAGLQHAVLGFGQSVYPTFQSCPRYTDKLLEALGSRRMVKRVELDEGPTETIAAGTESDSFTTMGTGAMELDREVRGRSIGLSAFVDHVHAALLRASATADAAPVCPWSEPGDGSVVEKTEEDLLTARPQTIHSDGPPQWLKYAAVALLAAAATHYYEQFFAGMVASSPPPPPPAKFFGLF